MKRKLLLIFALVLVLIILTPQYAYARAWLCTEVISIDSSFNSTNACLDAGSDGTGEMESEPAQDLHLKAAPSPGPL